VTEENDCAAVLNSSASPDQAAEAWSMGAEPAPRNIRNELTSGGSTEKFMMVGLLRVSIDRRRDRYRCGIE